MVETQEELPNDQFASVFKGAKVLLEVDRKLNWLVTVPASISFTRPGKRRGQHQI